MQLRVDAVDSLVIPPIAISAQRIKHQAKTPARMLFGQLLERFDHRLVLPGVQLVGIAGATEIDTTTSPQDARVVFASEVVHQRALLGRPQSVFSTMSFSSL